MTGALRRCGRDPPGWRRPSDTGSPWTEQLAPQQQVSAQPPNTEGGQTTTAGVLRAFVIPMVDGTRLFVLVEPRWRRPVAAERRAAQLPPPSRVATDGRTADILARLGTALIWRQSAFTPSTNLACAAAGGGPRCREELTVGGLEPQRPIVRSPADSTP